MGWFFFALALVLSLSKIIGIWRMTLLAAKKGSICARECVPLVAKWKSCGIDSNEVGSLFTKYGPLLSYEAWWEPRFSVRTRIPLGIVKALFWVPSLVLGWIALILLQVPRNRAVLSTSIVVLLALIWSYAAHMFLMRLYLGGLEFFFRTMSTTRATIEAERWLPPRHEIVRGYIFIVIGLFVLSIMAYSTAYYGIDRLDYGSFKDSAVNYSAATRPMSLATAIYFSCVTSSTVGFGDVTPVTEVARGVVVTQIMLSVGLLVLLLIVFSATTSVED